MTNKAQNKNSLPNFSQINPDKIVENCKQLIGENREMLDAVLSDPAKPNWDNLVFPIESMDAEFGKFWSPISHLHAVKSTAPLREAYKACLPMITTYFTEFSQNKQLFEKMKRLYDTGENFTQAQKQYLLHEIRDFKLAGVDLADADKQSYMTLKQKLSELQNRFEENLLDATQVFEGHFTDEQALKGLPEHALISAAEEAKRRDKSGYVFTLDFPSYINIMRFADDRQLRERFYKAYVTRASDQAPSAKKYDNSENMRAILKNRHELAKLLGFANYAELSLATKMATTPQEVMKFLQQLAEASRPQAEKEYQELSIFGSELGLDGIAPWDVEYVAEKYRQKKLNISQEELRPYFSEDTVLKGLFEIIHKLYGIQVQEADDVDVWDDDVRFFELYDEDGGLVGQMYMDLYARAKKRGGAWMDECSSRRLSASGEVKTPVAFLTCNFSSPTEDEPALFTHDEVVTLFHECGHCLHHLLTTVNVAGVSGIRGVPWDAVELPSQFFEHWCWAPEALALCAKHYKTGESLPEELLGRLLDTRNFLSAMAMVRQLEFAIFDFQIHMAFQDNPSFIQDTLNDVRKHVSVVKTPEYNRFQHGFAHVFAGGYDAGYYSYKWAEVLSSDAFSLFEEEGIFNQQVGLAFREHILSKGGSNDPMALFVAFRGRKPTVDALLRHLGIMQKS